MKAYRVSKDAKNESIEEKVELVKGYSVGDLLYVVREYEDSPSKFDEAVIKEVSSQLLKRNIICM